MGKKKHGRDNTETLQDVLDRPWCYYCNRDFNDQRILVEHMKAKHFKCECNCNRRLTTAGGLRIHMAQVHKQTLTKIANALPERDSGYPEIFAMEGIPPELIKQRADIITREYYKMAAEKRIASGAESATASDQPAAKKAKHNQESMEETKARLQARIAEVKARKAAEKAAAEAGGDVSSSTSTSTPKPFTESASNGERAGAESPTTSAAAQSNAASGAAEAYAANNSPQGETIKAESVISSTQPAGLNAAQQLPPHHQVGQQPTYGQGNAYPQMPYSQPGLPNYVQFPPQPAGFPQAAYPGAPAPGQYAPPNFNQGDNPPHLPGMYPPQYPPQPQYTPPNNGFSHASPTPPGVPASRVSAPLRQHHSLPAPPPGLPAKPKDKFDVDLAAMFDQAEQVAKSDEYRAKMEALDLQKQSAASQQATAATTTTASAQSEDAVRFNRYADEAGARRYAINSGKTRGPWLSVQHGVGAVSSNVDESLSWEENRARRKRYSFDPTAPTNNQAIGEAADAHSGPVMTEVQG